MLVDAELGAGVDLQQVDLVFVQWSLYCTIFHGDHTKGWRENHHDHCYC